MRKFLSALGGFFKRFFTSAVRQKLATDAINLAEHALPIVQRFVNSNGTVGEILKIAETYGVPLVGVLTMPQYPDSQESIKRWIGDIVSAILQHAFGVSQTQAQIARDVAYLNAKMLSAAEQAA